MAIADNQEREKKEIDRISTILSTGENYQGSVFSPDYINRVFTIWYQAGKPSNGQLLLMIPDPIKFGLSTGYPSTRTLTAWTREIENSFEDRAAVLDMEVSRQLGERLIAQKVAMLDSHAKIAAEMQDMAITYLRANKDKLSPNAAVRLLVEGVRIERESTGIPRTLEKLADRSDEELMKQIEDYLLRSPMETSPVEDE